MKIETDAQEMTELQKKHAFKVLKEMLHAIETMEESFVYFCSDKENQEAAKKLAKAFEEDENFDGTVDEPILYMSIFKAKVMSEYKRLNISINKLN